MKRVFTNSSGQNIVPYQILAYYIEKWPIYSLPQFGNSRRTLLATALVYCFFFQCPSQFVCCYILQLGEGYGSNDRNMYSEIGIAKQNNKQIQCTMFYFLFVCLFNYHFDWSFLMISNSND